MNKPYAWAANKEKLSRAIGTVGPEASEAEVRVEYERILGLVLNDDGTKGEVKEAKVEAVEEEAEKPVKKSKKS